MKRSDELIQKLNLNPHPEGGYYASIFKGDTPESNALRPQYTSIYFLLKENDRSHFHQLTADELWYFHEGSALTIHMIEPSGLYRTETLGLDIAKGERPQVLVKKGTIFGSTVNGDYGLVGCMVSPGFCFDDFTLFTEKELLERYPQHVSIIKQLTIKDS
ncbi:cupin [Halolactibacillus alkaliphilus]|uniref:Cupin n=1 Tax=Halolactibacillus alkaliphilus TaxID=442899 RepID=A0A511X4T9_9BACI|nr:cupin domain-containing protein [Halolactibacillus alkaliphilus]GEN57960.1 cupin [Halolactibacillus alkaliphilus]GGN66092.1 cupin [Halolactibacillus alkaliphilus]SFO67131.1 hypothetical protein SAMN05720591_1042 [Halolactibacillus alkaliphilus]